MLKNGVAFASINYPLLVQNDDIGVHKPLKNSSYCLQFLRHHHEVFNIDKGRIAAYGVSAGAGTALWLGTHDDMKNDVSLNPIEHESTRLSAVAVLEAQATYDFVRWPSILGNSSFNNSRTDEEIMEDVSSYVGQVEDPVWSKYYGIDSIQQLLDPATVAYRADVDMLDLMDKDDAPVWIQCIRCQGTGHHKNHSKALMKQADVVGLEHVAYIPKLGVRVAKGTDGFDLTRSADWLDFLLHHLKLP